ncbi:unnamed protein product [Enterobius vermicularis]|uniref:Coronin n=1 Tax=Enterobius vermicularis TaxID=51028 RepID=A0A0N4V7A5_ENTVE|nr:unnamed protein product [Enterobius vermicularis]
MTSSGSQCVLNYFEIGRVDKDYPYVDAHRAPCLEVAWSPFNDNVIASCSEDTTCKVWLIPANGLLRTLTEPVVELNGHQKRVNTIAWHPTANNILLTVVPNVDVLSRRAEELNTYVSAVLFDDSDLRFSIKCRQGGENKILIWNVGTGEALLEIAGHPDQIWSVSFNYDGSRFVTTCKDKRIRVIDSHTGEVLHQGAGHEGVKPQRAVYLRDGRIFTTGFTKRSERLYALRAQDNLENPIIQEELDTSNGVLFPLYDEDTGLVYLAGKGDCAIRYYEINNEYPFVHYINTFTTSEPQRGIGFMPKLGINSNENEVARIYKVTTKGVVDELQFFVPRKSDLFQSDLYPDTRSPKPALTAEQWIGGANAPPNLTPVNPGAAEAKPKVQVAKKANILAQLQPNQDVPTLHTSSPSRSPYDTPQRSPRPEESQQQYRFEEPAQPAPRSTRKPPVMDEDMGIVKIERNASGERERSRLAPCPEKNTSQLTPRQQVQWRPRSDRDNIVNQTAGQRRATIELERIRRDQARESDRDEILPPPSHMPQASPRHSIIGVPSEVFFSEKRQHEQRRENSQPLTLEDALADLQKMKAILRQHERRIRLLEDQLADKNMADTYGF